MVCQFDPAQGIMGLIPMLMMAEFSVIHSEDQPPELIILFI